MKRPSFQFYPGDWLRDTALQCCSMFTQGVWIKMLCFMHDGHPYGHLSTSFKDTFKDIPMDILSHMLGISLKETISAINELENHGVFSRNSEGIIYSRRMVNDETLRLKRAQGGFKSLDNPNVPKKKIPEEDILEGYHKGYPEGWYGCRSPASASAIATSDHVFNSPKSPLCKKQKPKLKESILTAEELPSWLPYESWSSFVQFRYEIKKPTTETGQRALLKQLTKFYEDGFDIIRVIQHAIASGHQGLYPPEYLRKKPDVEKTKQSGGPNGKDIETPAQRCWRLSTEHMRGPDGKIFNSN